MRDTKKQDVEIIGISAHPQKIQDQLLHTQKEKPMKAKLLDYFTTGIVWFAVLSTFNAVAMLLADVFNH